MLNILITLNSGQGVDLGPNFNLTADNGSVNPSTATLSELLAGKNVIVNDLATQIFITSTGTCTNSLTLNIPVVDANQVLEFIYGGIDAGAACANITVGAPNVYFYAPVGYNPFTIGNPWYLDSLLTTPYPDGFYAMHNINPNPYDENWAEIVGGIVVNNGTCLA
jgi:hypothetical protein